MTVTLTANTEGIVISPALNAYSEYIYLSYILPAGQGTISYVQTDESTIQISSGDNLMLALASSSTTTFVLPTFTSGSLTYADLVGKTVNITSGAGFLSGGENLVIAAGTASSSGSGSSVPCIPAGQRILTPTGYRLVESLRQGDLIKTAAGRTAPTTIYKTTVTTTKETAPIRIGGLRLSPNHAFKIGQGWMFPQIAATHGLHGSIQEAPGVSVVYYHIETPNYLQDDLVVEGVTVESFGANFVKKNNINPTTLYTLSKKGLWFNRMNSTKGSGISK